MSTTPHVHVFRVLALCAALAAIACGDGDDGPLGDAGSGDGGANINRVSGNFSQTSVAESSIRKLPIDLTGVPIIAIMSDGEEIVGVGESNGSFEILEVPTGPYTLRIGNRYFVTEVRRFDLSVSVLGREDLTRVDSHTPITLSLSDVVPWQTGDSIELFSASGGFSYIDALSSDPTAGATTATGLVDGLLAAAGGEVDSAEGDVLHISQVRQRVSGNATIHEAIAGSAAVEGVSIRNGEASSVTAALTPSTETRTLSAEWDNGAYLATMSEVGPGTPLSIRSRFRLVATPTDTQYGLVAPFPTLVAAELTGDATSTVTASVASPFPTHWEELEVDELSAVVELTPGGSAVTVRAQAVSTAGRLELGATPVLSAPTDVRIAGQDATSAITASGPEPMISWSAPTVGAADGYEVLLLKLEPDFELTASFHTLETSVRVPAGLLADDGTYYLIVRSRSNPTIDLGADPLGTSVPSAFAEFATAPFTP